MLDFLKQLTDPQSIIQYGGLWLLLFVVFAETGLFVGFFLPGDSLIFISGLLCATKPDLLGVPFLDVANKVKITATTVLIILGEITFWVGGFLLGKEILNKYKAYLNPKTWFKKKSVKEAVTVHNSTDDK